MSIGSINIHSVNARLERHTTLPSVNMSQQQAQVHIESELPRVVIDQTECFNTSGLKNNTALIETAASEGRQNILQYTETIVNDGKTFAAIENGVETGKIVADIATRNSFQEHYFNVVSMPTARPRIDVVGGSLNISFSPKDLGNLNGVQFDVRLGSLETRYVPGGVTVDYRV